MVVILTPFVSMVVGIPGIIFEDLVFQPSAVLTLEGRDVFEMPRNVQNKFDFASLSSGKKGPVGVVAVWREQNYATQLFLIKNHHPFRRTFRDFLCQMFKA